MIGTWSFVMQQYIKILPNQITEEHIIKSCEFVCGATHEQLYMKFDKQYQQELSESADPWVILCLHKMLRAGGDFYVHGAVSASLMDNLEKYCDCWRTLKPEYKNIKIIPESEVQDPVHELPNRAIMTFSGGLDASFTLFRHKTGQAGRNTKNIERAILLFGAADTPLDRPEEFKIHADNARTMCESMGVDFLTVETNFRDYYNDWEQEHFNLIVSALYFFEKYPYKITASSLCVLPVSYKMWSSNPITDLMLSCNSANVISDDVAYDRVMKANVVKNWKLATKKMRVCWAGADKSKNCGECEKCIRTMLNFIACGIDTPLEMFPANAYENMYENAMKITHFPRWQWVRLLEILGQEPEKNKKYIKIINDVLNPGRKKIKKHKHSFWWHVRHMKF